MKIILLASAFLVACSSDNVMPLDGGGDVQNGMDATMMMDSTTMMDTGGQDTSMSSDAPNDTSSSDSPSDSPADTSVDVNLNHCNNNVKDVDETDIDCGGLTCAKCGKNKMCMLNADCQSNSCVNMKCQ